MRIGLLGYGSWGRRAARACARVGELAVIVDPNPHSQLEARTDWAAWGTLVASEPEVAYRECDAIWVATPTAEHYRSAREALEHGCHVLCEKPVVTTLAEADDLIDAARDARVALMGGHLSLFTRTHDAALASGARGDILAIRRNCQPSLSDGSVLWGLGPHDIAAVLDLRGLPLAVGCQGTKHRVEAVLEFEDSSARLELDWLAETRWRRFAIADVDYSGTPDVTEPLLREALAFAHLCGDAAEHEHRRREIRGVSWVLEELEAKMVGAWHE